MSVLARYFSARIGLHVGLVLLGLTALGLAFELMKEGDRVLKVSSGETAALARFALLRLPDHAAQMLPFACLLGPLITLGLLLRHSELTAVWSGGISSLGVLRALTPIAVLLGGTQFALDDQAVPATLDSQRAWGVGEYRARTFTQDEAALWVLTGPDIVRIERAAGRGGVLQDLTIFHRDDAGTLLSEIHANRAEPAARGWTLYDVSETSATTAEVQHQPQRAWEQPIDLTIVPLLAKALRELTLGEIDSLVANHGFGQQPESLARTWFFARLSVVATPLLMFGLVVALARWRSRAGALGQMMAFAIAIAFGYFILDRTALAMGESGLLPPWFAGFGMKLALACLVGWLFVRNEG